MLLKTRCTRRTVLRAGYVLWRDSRASLIVFQVAYFNKQRVLAERQRATLEAAEKQRLESQRK